YGLRTKDYGLFLVCFFICTLGLSQDFKKQFKQAKELFANENYSAAMDAFRPLTIYDRANPYPEYASFYYALSAQKLGFNTVAKEMFSQTKSIYPEWDQLDEVNYWLYKIYLGQREYFHALKLSAEIRNNALMKEIDAMKRDALSKVEDVEILKMLMEENPNDYEVIRALAYGLGKSAAPADTALLDSIAHQKNWNKKDFITLEDPPLFKDVYRIALLLPFRANSLDPSPTKKRSQFVLDLYEGMKQAADSLVGEGVRLDLLAYDTDHDAETIKSLLKEEELKTADLIVGPLFAEDSKSVQEFSEINKINLVVNPLSFNIDLVGQNPFAFLFQPCHKTIGEKSAEILASKTSNKNCFVFYGESPKDSVMAFSFIKAALSLGVKIPYAEEVRGETSGKILETLATATEYDEWKNPTQFKLKLDSIGSVFVASDDPLIYTKVINSVETRGDSVLVVGQENWLEDNSVELSKFEKIKITFAAPNFSSVNGKPYLEFRKKYLQHHGVLPGPYAQKGFEFMMVMGRALKKYGAHFQRGLSQDGVNGVLTSGYQMQLTRDNARVPFIAFLKGKLETLNRP
ncbi:MAG: amino acid ABC transporter substrate-binding protein, partial [Bacteroidetes bacterium]|nr:amino acid ABC transporter substrate-binding protein [Bacteroidota bacterium]